MKYEVKAGTRPNAHEVYFDVKPDVKTREALKALKMRWNGTKACWYGFVTEKAINDAINGAPQQTAEKKNKYGIKVGDVFHMSWGYEQTNNDFFQVVEILGDSAVRVCDVRPVPISERAVSGMSCDYEYKLDGSMLQKSPSSIFIKDNEKGDKKIVKAFSSEWGNDVYIKISDYYARLFTGGTVYESWYA